MDAAGRSARVVPRRADARVIPHRALERKSLYDRLTKLELDLTEAIKSERYEDAARTRDEISRVKQAFDAKPSLKGAR